MSNTWKASFVDLRHQLDEMFDELIYRRWSVESPQEWRPALDFAETPGAYFVEIDLPDVAPELVHIELTEHGLTITGSRSPVPPEGLVASRRERMHGRFQRAVEFPHAVDLERAEAYCHHGTYRVRLPKKSGADSSSTVGGLNEERSPVVLRVTLLEPRNPDLRTDPQSSGPRS